jgi:hypothetical protein
MGLGLRLEGEGSSLRFGHGGDDEGFVAQLLASAVPGPAVVVMVNSDYGDVLLRPLVEAVARAEGWWEREILPQPPHAEPGGDLDRYCGRYQLPDGRLLRIERQADSLALIPPGQEAISLFPAGEDRWSARSVNATVTFAYDRDPTPASLVLHQEAMYVQDIEALRAR